MYKSSNPISVLRSLVGMTVVTVLTFFVAALISLNSPLSSASIKSLLKEVDIQGVLVEMIRSEVHALPPKADLPSITEVSLDLLINIKPKDVRTFLGNEIPGLALYHTEIAVAGEGTNFANLPIESPPPKLEDLLEQSDDPEEDTKKEGDESNHKIENKNKTVFIYHSHSWEAFNPLLKNQKNTSSSSNEKENVIGIGDKFKSELEDKGIGVTHSKKNVAQELASRNWNYFKAYEVSRETVQEAINNDDKLKYFIDIHRDSQPKHITTITINKKSYARLFFVVGKEHKNYEKNRDLAETLDSRLKKKYPGLSRGVIVKSKFEGDGVYNQDLTDRALLIEFGGVDNDLTELYNSAEALADVFSEYYWGESEI